MAEINTVIAEASQDLQTIEDFVNLPADSEVYPRLLPSVNVGTLAGTRDAIFRAGGLPAEPFETLANMEADGASLPDGQLAMVYNETTNNGLYIKTAGAWVKSAYDPAESAIDYMKNNGLGRLHPQIAGKVNYDTTDNTLTFDTLLNILTADKTLYIGAPTVIDVGGGYGSHRIEFNVLTNKLRAVLDNTVRESGWIVVAGFSKTTTTFTTTDFEGYTVDGVEPVTLTIDAAVTEIKTDLSSKPNYNIFKYVGFPQVDATSYKGTTEIVGGEAVLSLNRSPESSYPSVIYKQKIEEYVKVGETVTLSVEGFSGVGLDGAGLTLSIHAISSDGTVLERSVAHSVKSLSDGWVKLTAKVKIPEETDSILWRFIGNMSTEATSFQFKRPVLQSTATPMIMIGEPIESAHLAETFIRYVSKTGSDSNHGKSNTNPFLTLQKAVDSLPESGEVIVLDSGEYRESLNISKTGHIKISPIAGNRINIFGSEKLEVTKTVGMMKVYQAPLTSKPDEAGIKKLASIYEWGTPSKKIEDDERHYLHHGLSHRLPYTEMGEVDTKAELDSVNGKWFWEDGVIYFTATDGGDARLKRYERRARPVLSHSVGSIELVRVTSWFSRSSGMSFQGMSTKRTACISYGSLSTGFLDNANFTESYRDISGGTSMDGFGIAVKSDSLDPPEITSRIEQVYFDPYGHDNGDDGLSCHYRSDSTIYGGLFEYNTKADVVHVTGANCVCYNTEARGTTYGFYTATDPVLDSERSKTVMRCVNTKATGNKYSYTATSASELHLDVCTAIDPVTLGYQQSGEGVILANDCRYIGDELKVKSGNVVVTNTNPLV